MKRWQCNGCAKFGQKPCTLETDDCIDDRNLQLRCVLLWGDGAVWDEVAQPSIETSTEGGSRG